MPVGAIIGATTVAGAAMQASAANKAAKIQGRAADQARQDMLPYSIPGQGAMATLAGFYGIDPETGERTGQPFDPEAMKAFYQSPDYNFALQGGIEAVENSNAGQGLLKSGNLLQGLTRFGQGLATQTFGNTVSSLQRLAQIGAGAAGGAGQAAMAGGAAQASGVVGAANAYGGALGNMGNYFMMQSLLKPQGSTYTPQQPYASMAPGIPGYNPAANSGIPGGYPTGFF